MKNISITGGAGFIGQKLVETLLSHDNSVNIKVLDSFHPQIHDRESETRFRKKFPNVNLKNGNILDINDLDWLISESDIFIHLASETGTGQSMYNIVNYTNTNITGTSLLLERLLESGKKIKHFILSSSRSIYGEGAYLSANNQPVSKNLKRKIEDMKVGKFDIYCPKTGNAMKSIATNEDCIPNPLSFYAATKLFQEQQINLYKEKLFFKTTIFRFQNVYGEGQSLNNPYTGLLAVFFNLANSGKNLNVFEDGNESRDFIHVDDVVRTLKISMLSENNLWNGVFNLGTGKQTSIIDVANNVVEFFNNDISINISGDFRIGDIRHNFADTTKIESLGIKTNDFISFNEGYKRFLNWAKENGSTSFNIDEATSIMKDSGMYHEN
ncbi:NAD-dependent epimerase/dehydratase family protein [Gammaproteobacteria bacterium]|nr:NAD-dependent epimerase/dehydratase family protein [Gammaproteobacteria bacterium]